MTDAFDRLFQPVMPVTPPARFVAALRGRVVAELGLIASITLPERTTPMPVQSTDPGVVPYLCVHDGVGALSWYAEAFGAVETSRWVGDDGRVGHAEFNIGAAVFYLADEYPEMGVVSPRTLGGTPVALHLPIDDVDSRFETAVRLGATGLRAPEDQSHGNRNAVLLDPYGHRWMISRPLGERTLEQLQADNPDYEITTRPSPSSSTSSSSSSD